MTHQAARVVSPIAMRPRPSIRKILRHSWVLAAGAVIGLIAAAAVTSSATPVYTSRASLQFSLGYATSATDINQGAAYTRSEVLSYAELATSTTVLQPVLRQLQLDLSPGALASRISVTTPPNTSVLHVAATDVSPDAAAEIANAVANSLSTYVVAQSPSDDLTGPLLDVTTIASASAPSAPSSPRPKVNLAAGLLLGLLGGALAATVLFRADTRLRTVADIAAVTDAPVLGTLERHRPAHASQDMRMLAAALRHSLTLQPAPALVCTPVAREADVTALTENLAANLSALGVPAAAVSSGRSEGEPHALDLDSAHGRLLALREESDTVLVATPSVEASADAAVLASVASGALIVVHAGVARAQHLRAVLQQLTAVGLAVRGIILDEARPAHASTTADTQESEPAPESSSEADPEPSGEPEPGAVAEAEERPEASDETAPVQSLQRG